MNDKKKPEPKETAGILKRITEAIESIIKRQDIISERLMAVEEQLRIRKER